MITAEKQYVLNRETGKIELHFTKQEYNELTYEQKENLKRFFLWSPQRQAWVSRSKDNHFMAIHIAKQLGFSDGGKIGERLTYEEELQRKAEKAEARAERYLKYAKNAEKRAEELQKEMNEHFVNHDIAFFTQPIIRGNARSERFARQRQKILDRYLKGFEEYRKSEYFRKRAEIAQRTADMKQLQDRSYLNNKIEECEANIRKYEKLIITAQENNNSEWMENLLEKLEYEIDKLAFFKNCLDNLGGVQYSKENIKPGYLVKVRNNWYKVLKANQKTIELESPFSGLNLKYTYAEIEDVKIPENWTETKQDIKNPFKIGDILVRKNIASNMVIAAFQVIKITKKSVTLQKIAIEDGKPVKDKFITEKQERRQVKQDRQGNYVVNDGDWYLYLYRE